MKKGFLFGFGIFLAGLTFAVVSSVTMGTKEAGNQITASEMNQLINTLSGIYNDEGNYIGIGVSSPEAKLDVDGTIRANEVCDETGANCKDISTGWAGSWVEDGDDIYYTTGNVGINTSSPNSRLHVNGTVTATSFVGDGSGLYNATPWTQLSDRIYYMGTGLEKVGIGLINPAYKLDVNGDINLTGAIWQNGIKVLDGGTIGTGGSSATGDDAFATGTAAIATGIAAFAAGNQAEAGGNAAIAVGNNVEATGAGSAALGDATLASGNISMAVGLNTTAQAYASFVLGRYNVVSGTGNSWVSTDPIFVIGNGADANNRANAVTILKSGLVGIGTTTPSSKVDIEGHVRVRPASKGTCTVSNVGAIAYEESGNSGNFYGCRKNSGNYEWAQLNN
ncbi:hypothetical protein K9M41_00610 [Candidatus Gracilibacteria bacterium]|nr:hypothetical protein [Candidatus Gracilibacteria bacterium]